MPLTLQLVNETTLPDGGPVSFQLSGKCAIDIGRAAHLDWTLPDPTKFISNKHCEIRYKDGGCRWWKHRAANREMFCRPSTRGWVSAIVVNAIWRQREADDEARKRLVGDYSPTFFERVRVGIDAKFYKGRKPPRFLPQYMPMARLDDAYSHSEDGKRSLHDDDGH